MSTMATSKAAGFTHGDVVRYKPSHDWCHHGIAIVHVLDSGKVFAADTYWGSSPTDNSYVDIKELDSANIIGNVITFGGVPYPHHYDDFADADKYYVPMGGGSAYRRVRIGAVPVPEQARHRLAYAVERAESAVRSTGWNLEQAKKDLAAFDEAIAKLEAQQ
jgi:hypothetical protein